MLDSAPDLHRPSHGLAQLGIDLTGRSAVVGGDIGAAALATAMALQAAGAATAIVHDADPEKLDATLARRAGAASDRPALIRGALTDRQTMRAAYDAVSGVSGCLDMLVVALPFQRRATDAASMPVDPDRPALDIRDNLLALKTARDLTGRAPASTVIMVPELPGLGSDLHVPRLMAHLTEAWPDEDFRLNVVRFAPVGLKVRDNRSTPVVAARLKELHRRYSVPLDSIAGAVVVLNCDLMAAVDGVTIDVDGGATFLANYGFLLSDQPIDGG